MRGVTRSMGDAPVFRLSVTIAKIRDADDCFSFTEDTIAGLGRAIMPGFVAVFLYTLWPGDDPRGLRRMAGR